MEIEEAKEEDLLERELTKRKLNAQFLKQKNSLHKKKVILSRSRVS
jgi:hypothetical protein